MDCAEDVSRIGMTPAYEMGVTEATARCPRAASRPVHVDAIGGRAQVCTFCPASENCSFAAGIPRAPTSSRPLGKSSTAVRLAEVTAPARQLAIEAAAPGARVLARGRIVLSHASRQLHGQLVAAIETLSPVPDGVATAATADGATLVAWADVLVRDLSIVSNRLDTCAADDSSYAYSMTSLEEAWWRIAAARVKIGAMLTMALGLPVLRIEKNQIRFKPDDKRLLRQLRKIGEHDPDALRLVAALESVMPAKDMRNHLSHSYPPVWDGVVAPFTAVYMNEALDVLDVTRFVLPPHWSMTRWHGDSALHEALRTARVAERGLHDATALCANLISAHGRVGAGVPTFFHVAGRWQNEDPRTGSAGDDIRE